MIKYFARITGIILMGVGLFGIFIVKIPYVVELDIWQSAVYFILGLIGISLGWFSQYVLWLKRYLEVVTAFVMLMLLAGLTLPNLFDIFHLEVVENFFHAILFVFAIIVGIINKKRTALLPPTSSI
ncbi:MAG: hypothetical protein WC575_00435 [Patescibacteria group bacterium]